MIRICRLRFLGKNYVTRPFLCQSTSFLSKLLFVEFSDIKTGTEFEYDNGHQQSPVKTLQNILKVEEGTLGDNVVLKSNELFWRNFSQKLNFYSPKNILKALKLFTFSQSIPISAAKCICDTLVKKTDYEFSEWECSDFLFCLSKLKYRYKPGISLIIDTLRKNSNGFGSVKVINSLMHSFSKLKVRDPYLLEMLIKSQLMHPFHLTSSLSVIKTCSILNFSHPQLDKLIEPLSKMEETEFFEIKQYVTFVWSCVLLEKYNYVFEKHIKNVLSSSFLKKLGYGMLELNQDLKFKLLNINAAASIMPSYYGPFLNDLPDYKNFYAPSQKTELLNSVKDSLIYTVNKKAEVVSLVDTNTGFYLDFVCHLHRENSSNKLFNLVEDVKLGVMLLNYNNVCDDGTMTGPAALKLKVLKAQGYKMVVISHSEYPLKDKLSKKIGYLRMKIESAIQNNQAIS